MGWWFGLAPATLEFWVLFPHERNQGKQAHLVLKYRVRSKCPLLSPSPHANSLIVGTAVIINTHIHTLPAPREHVIGIAVVNTHIFGCSCNGVRANLCYYRDVRSGPGAARTILPFHTISARPSQQPRIVGSTLGVYTVWADFCFCKNK